MDIRSTVEATIKQVAAENHVAIPPLQDDLALLDTGLDSLCLAVIVARLEDALGSDPFSAADEIEFPVTVGDFVALYQNAIQ